VSTYERVKSARPVGGLALPVQRGAGGGTAVFENSHVFSSFSVDDLEAAERFYGGLLGMRTSRGPMGILDLDIGRGQHVMVYPKDDHEPASYTVLNFEVSDVEAAVDELTASGVHMERYDDAFGQDAKGISPAGRGPRMAWFKDPAGNVISVLETDSAES
jgi:catechol 2,3-dioxygenase-like lactoylglutathione lyase family enzyme